MNPTLKQPFAWIPPVMSLTALTVVPIHIAVYGIAPEVDEGATAHLFQILIAAQVPVIAAFGIKSLTREPKQTLMVLLLQGIAIVAALAPVWFLGL